MAIPGGRVLTGVSGRVPAIHGTGDVAAAELATLLLLGAGAALATTFFKLPLRIPGSAIVWSIFPTALGIALVPRRGAGTIISATALATILALGAGGARTPGPGAAASLTLAGPLLDVALLAARTGWRLYAGFVLAGLVANLIAFAARGGIPGISRGAATAGGGYGGGPGGGLGGGGGHGLHRGLGAGPGAGAMGGHGLRYALLTYAACGLLAGLLSAVAWFQLQARPAGADAAQP